MAFYKSIILIFYNFKNELFKKNQKTNGDVCRGTYKPGYTVTPGSRSGLVRLCKRAKPELSRLFLELLLNEPSVQGQPIFRARLLNETSFFFGPRLLNEQSPNTRMYAQFVEQK